jgi:sucrose phosphorylase
VRNQVQLVACADRLGGSLAGPGRLLTGPLAGLFGGLHLLPSFLPYDGVDAGFDPVDHLRVDPRPGSWDEVRRLGYPADLIVDLIVNHMSADSAQFRDVVAGGTGAPHAGMSSATAGCSRPERPRPTRCASSGRGRAVAHADDSGRSAAAGLDHLHPPAGRPGRTTRRPGSICLRGAAAAGRSGVGMLRLDPGYTVKTAGSSCFMTPETIEFITDLTAEAPGGRSGRAHRGARALPARGADRRPGGPGVRPRPRAADPARLFTGDGGRLRDWLARRPGNAVTVLDTRDGIGLVDAAASRDGAGAALQAAACRSSPVRTVGRTVGTHRRRRTRTSGGVKTTRTSCRRCAGRPGVPARASVAT